MKLGALSGLGPRKSTGCGSQLGEGLRGYHRKSLVAIGNYSLIYSCITAR